MTRKIKPLNNRVVVRDEPETEKVTKSGIILSPSIQKEGEHQIGDVIAVGEGFYKESGEFIRPLNVKIGDKVIYGMYAGINAVLDDIPVRLMEEIDILGTIEE